MLIVQDYVRPFLYDRKKGPIEYSFEMEEETVLGDLEYKSRYSQRLTVDFKSEINRKGMEVTVKTSAIAYELDKLLLPQQRLTEDLAKLTEELHLRIGMHGEIKEILKHKDLIDKWDAMEVTLKRRNQGTLAHGYLAGIREKIENKEWFLKDLQQYRLLGLFFNEYLDVSFDSRYPVKRTREFKNVVYSIGTSIEEKLQLEKQLENGDLVYGFKGKLLPISSQAKDRIRKYFKYYGLGGDQVYLDTYEGSYVVNKDTVWPEQIELNVTWDSYRGFRRSFVFRLKKETIEEVTQKKKSIWERIMF